MAEPFLGSEAIANGTLSSSQLCTGYTRLFRDVYVNRDVQVTAALPEMGVVARQLWHQAGLGPAAVRTAVLYDHFTPYVLLQLEELGFCARGEARDFIADGAIEIGGLLPLNTHGGQLGEAYIHGMNGIAEAVRQVRGTSVNQVPGDGPVLVTAGTGVPTSGLILSLLPRVPVT